jgi:hypothetical protein
VCPRSAAELATHTGLPLARVQASCVLLAGRGHAALRSDGGGSVPHNEHASSMPKHNERHGDSAALRPNRRIAPEVRYVSSHENRSHGSTMGIKLRRFCNGRASATSA